MDKKYIVIYEEDAKRIFDLFSFEGEEDFKEQVKSYAEEYFDTNKDFLYENYLYYYYEIKNPETAPDYHDEFDSFTRTSINKDNGYTFLDDISIYLYEIDEELYKEISEGDYLKFKFDTKGAHVFGKVDSEGKLK